MTAIQDNNTDNIDNRQAQENGTEPLVLSALSDGVGTITLNHRAKRNALSAPLLEALAQALRDFQQQQARVVIIRAQPESRVWSAGHDVNELPVDGKDPLAWQDPLRSIIRDIEQYPAPIIALVEGGVWGGACELVFACDLVVACPKSTFAATPAKLGVPYNATGLLTFLNNMPLHWARELLFTANPMSAQRLERKGVINHIVDSEHISEFTHQLALSIARNSPLAIGVMKEQLRILAGAYSLSASDFERIQGLRRVVYQSHDYREGILAFKERRAPNYRGD